MTVIRPNSISGITSITAQANEINVFRSNGLIAGLNLNGVNFNTTAGISTLAALKITGNLDVAGVLTYQDVTNVDSLGIGTFRVGVNVPAGQLDVGSNIKLGNAGVITATSFVGSGAQLTGITQTTINNNTNNYVVTATGTANTLNGESNFTYDGDIATITRSANAAGGLSIVNTNNSQASAHARLELSAGDNSSAIFRMECNGHANELIADGSGNFRIDDNGTERLRITSGGTVVIGDSASATPTGKLHLYQASNDSYMYIQRGSGNSQVAIGGIFWKNSGNNLGLIDVQSQDVNDAVMRLYTMGGGTLSERFRLRNNNSGGVALITSPATGDTLNLQTDAGGGQGMIFGTDISGTSIYLKNNSSGTFGFQYRHGSTTQLEIKNNGSIQQYASGGENQFISKRTGSTYSNGDYFFYLFAKNNGDTNVGSIGIVRDTGNDNSRIMFSTATGGTMAERLRINQHGTITNTTTSSHSQGAGTFNIKGVINQYSQGSGSGLIFDCDFGRLTGYSDDSNVNNGTNLSACLAHSTTDWTSSSSNTPMTVNGGTFQYRSGFGGYFDAISNGGRVSIGAGSGVPAFSDKLNTANMTIEAWCWYDGDGREVIASRYGSGFPNNFNMLADPNGQFHYNSSGAGAGGGNVSGEHFPDKTWHHHLWQYESGVHRWYINGAFANSRSAGTSVAVNSGTGFAIFSRADRMEDWRGKIALVRIYNRALSAAEIKNHFELERGRFGV